jgi:hypothetical protein
MIHRRGLLHLTAGLLASPALVRAGGLAPLPVRPGAVEFAFLPFKAPHYVAQGDTLRTSFSLVAGPVVDYRILPFTGKVLGWSLPVGRDGRLFFRPGLASLVLADGKDHT